jgi:protein SCO1
VKSCFSVFTILIVFAAGFATRVEAQTTYGRPALLRNVGINQKMGAQLPLDVPFTDDQGRAVTLREYTGKPIVLALVYYSCPSLCDLVLNAAVHSVRGLKFNAGDDFQFVAVSFDPRENYMLARDKKANYVKEYGRDEAAGGFHFLTGTEASSKMLADSVGFHFAYDPTTNQYAHPSAIMIVTPEGKISRYFYGIDYPARDVKLGLMDATGGKIGSAIDQVQLFCFHYDPATGKYGVLIMNVLRLAGIVTLILLGGIVWLMFRRERGEKSRVVHG